MGHFKCESWDIISVSQDDKISCHFKKQKQWGVCKVAVTNALCEKTQQNWTELSGDKLEFR